MTGKIIFKTCEALYDERRYPNNRRELTYILGSRCIDGVVLVGDRKVTLSGGTDFDFEDKILMDVEPMVVGSSGVSGLFDKFRSQVGTLVQSHQAGMEIQKFISEIEKITKTLNDSYHEILQEQVFDVLLAFKLPRFSALQYIYPFGFAEGVRKYRAIGHGEPYGSILLKQLWRQNMNMEQVAELGYFIIKYIEKFELDNSVGVGSGHPQIWFIPDDPAGISEEEKAKYRIHMADNSLLERFQKETEKKLELFQENTFKKFFSSTVF